MTVLPTARRHPGVVAALLLAAALAWWWTSTRMAGMDAGPGTDLGTIGWFTGSWAVMMAAMMLPSFGPTLGSYLSLVAGRGRGRWLPFACGYLVVWTVTGVAAYAIFELGKSALASDLAWHRGGRWLSAAVLLAAAAYEFVPFKRACLTRCRGRLGDDHGPAGQGWPAALVMGTRSGAWCLGCSWALMVALFALGVMSLTWMALIAVLVGFEKVGPWPLGARVATAAILAALAIGIFAAPHQVPGLVVPGSPGMHAMMRMG
jgi:predicted metal-binding membrane protein